MRRTQQGTALMTLLASLIALIVVLQMWLVSAALDALLGGSTGVLWPAALASVLLAVGSGVLLSQALRY
ncbi:MAG TPA: DUF6755 family protein, partial [Minicystis sp.]|nr:DUF6755 family protein [Minicystis sp.]